MQIFEIIVRWWLSPESLVWRLGLGGLFFMSMALADIFRNGRSATRWREYLYMIAGIAAAVVYGLFNDFVSSAISWEYFYYGKGFCLQYSSTDMVGGFRFYLEVAAVAVSATWWVGLVIAAAQLFCNSVRSKKMPALKLPELLRLWIYIIAAAVLFSAIGFVAGLSGAFDSLGEFTDIIRDNLFRPRRFIAAWGLHLGAYVGGIAGLIYSCWQIFKIRRGRCTAQAKS